LSCASGLFFSASGDQVNITQLTCSDKIWPEILVQENQACSPQGTDGQHIAPGDLAKVQLGWYLDGVFKEQISACQDKKSYATLWTKHTVIGKSIALRSGRNCFDIFVSWMNNDPRFALQGCLWIPQNVLGFSYSKCYLRVCIFCSLHMRQNLFVKM
jgi:hypothetical protein